MTPIIDTTSPASGIHSAENECYRLTTLRPGVGPAKCIAVCSDGVERVATFTAENDTFFSRPARVAVKGKTVSGYITSETLDGWSTETEGDPGVFKFSAYAYGKNAGLLPRGVYKREPDASHSTAVS